MTDRTWTAIRRSVPASHRDGIPDNCITYGAWKSEDGELWITMYRAYRHEAENTHYLVVESTDETDITEFDSYTEAENELEVRKQEPGVA